MNRAILLWVCAFAYLNIAGWVLSGLHELNAMGYEIAMLPGLAAAWFWRRDIIGNSRIFPRWAALRRRLCKPFPAIYFLVAALAFFGGILHAPNNFDAMTYRLPRMLNWLAAGHWIWIPTINERLNCSDPAWEWTAMPLLALTRSDRALFLIDLSGYLLMPGLLFSIFRQLGVARRVAWTWMWILPLAYGYATQAGSVGNDLTGGVLCLVSVFFGLRSRRSGKVEHVWLAVLAAALMTGVKISNAPLALPCLAAMWPALGLLRRRVVGSLVVAGIAVVVSAVPIMILNQLHTGSWTGDPTDRYHMRVDSPGAALLGNGVLLVQQSFMPPVLPNARKMDDLFNKNLPVSWQQTLNEKFPRYRLNHLNELPQEEIAGLGLGVTLLLLVSAIGAIGGVGRSFSTGKIFSSVMLVGLAAWVAALVYVLKMGSEAAPRLMLPYYPLLVVPFLLAPAQERLLRFRLWRIITVVAALSVLPAIVLSPSRPLFPLSMVEKFAQCHPGSALAQRLVMVYTTYAQRNDLLAPLRAGLPADVKKVGYVAGSNDTDYSLWRPLSTRQVVCLQNVIQNSTPLPEDLEWMVVKQTDWPEFSQLPLEEWASRHHAEIVLSIPLVTVVAKGEETWCLLHLKKP